MNRNLEFFLTLLISLVLIPFLLIIGIFVFFILGRPIIFAQERIGFKGKPFKLYKFRTMEDVFTESGQPLPDELRLTKFGRFLRRSSLDELPELLNVLRGDMSLVGPRPLLTEYLPLYSVEQARRHEVRPGITGWAQVNGRNAISWDDKFRLDLWYVERKSLLLDLKILFLTAWKLFSTSDVSASGHATMPKFTGNKLKD